MSKFQIILTAIFVVCIVLGVVLFASYKSNSGVETLPPVTIWGTFPESTINNLVYSINSTRPDPFTVTYVQKTPETFNTDFVEALARNQGPDAVLITQDMILRHADKVTVIPYTVVSERDFKNTYIPQAELYLTSQGSLAVPFTVNPLVMYWNRDLFTNAGIATYPKFWDEFTTITSKINLRDVNSNIRRSALSLGEFANVDHAREILGALLIQAGNPITLLNDGRMTSVLGDNQFSGSRSSTPAVTFFTKFSNPRDPEYSWNRSLPSSKSWFLSGNLATYFGFASELLDLRAKNPNINFDVAPVPQIRSTVTNRVTYGSMYGFSLVKRSQVQAAAYTVIQYLTTPSSLAFLGKASYLPPVRRDMIATGSSDPYLSVFYDSALISRGWLDIDSTKTSQIFQTMVESVTSGRVGIYSAIQTAQGQMNLILEGSTL